VRYLFAWLRKFMHANQEVYSAKYAETYSNDDEENSKSISEVVEVGIAISMVYEPKAHEECAYDEKNR